MTKFQKFHYKEKIKSVFENNFKEFKKSTNFENYYVDV